MFSLRRRFGAALQAWNAPPPPPPVTTPEPEPPTSPRAGSLELLENRRLLSGNDPAAAAVPQEPSSPVAVAPLADGMTGPLSLDNFNQADDGSWTVDGSVALPGGQSLPFTTDADIRIADAGDSVTILDVTLGPVDLDLLGLRLDLQRVGLRVTATAGEGQVLGNVLTELLLSDPDLALDTVARPLNEALGSAQGGGDALMTNLPMQSTLASFDEQLAQAIDFDELDATTGGTSLLDRLPTTGGIGTLNGGVGSQIELPDEVRVLSLSIGELDLNLLGLRVQTTEPVDLSVRATAGPGKLLGNLFVAISSLADPLLPDLGQGGGTGGGGDVPVPPSSMDLLADDEIPLIGVELRDVDLYLLGLEASLNVDLLVGLQTEQDDFLGRLLLNELELIEQEILSADFSPLDRLMGFLFNGGGAGTGGGTIGDAIADAAGEPQTFDFAGDDGGDAFVGDAVPALASAFAPANNGSGGGGGSGGGSGGSGDPEPITLVNLNIDELDLDLLGVLIRSEGISLELRVDPGPGALLGNVLGRLVGAFESGGGTGGGGGGGGQQPLRNATDLIEAESFDRGEGVTIDGPAVSFFNEGDVLAYDRVDFGDGGGIEQFTATLAVPNDRPGQAVEVRVDSPTGPQIGRLAPAGTGSWNTYAAQSVPVLPTSGVKDVYLVGDSPNPLMGIAKIDNFTFGPAGGSGGGGGEGGGDLPDPSLPAPPPPAILTADEPPAAAEPPTLAVDPTPDSAGNAGRVANVPTTGGGRRVDVPPLFDAGDGDDDVLPLAAGVIA